MQVKDLQVYVLVEEDSGVLDVTLADRLPENPSNLLEGEWERYDEAKHGEMTWTEAAIKDFKYINADIPLPSYECDECGHFGPASELRLEVDSAEDADEDGSYRTLETKFCPECGSVVKFIDE